jgi:FKBP-type peptidyl-prolyl cis-trans isomerase FklB
MKLTVFSLLLGVAAAPVFAAEGDSKFPDPKERTSYALGLNFGSNLKTQGVEVNVETLRKGIEDALAGNPQLNETELKDTFNNLRTQITARAAEKGKENKAAGDKWLAENKSKQGVLTTASGLQYKIVSDGTGESPKPGEDVQVKYTGRLIDGTVFDSTDKRGGEPARFKVGQVIPGWTEALQLMKKGSKWELYIPSQLAYGERATGAIPQNSTLIFDVELVDFTKGTAPVPAQPVTSDIIKVPSAEEMKKGAKIEIIKPEDVDKEIEKEKARKATEGKAGDSKGSLPPK